VPSSRIQKQFAAINFMK